MKHKYFLLGVTVFVGTALSTATKAVCPVCIVAVGAGLGLSRWLGVDDVISSLWIGGILVAISIWTIIWLRKKEWEFRYMSAVVPVVYYILTLLPLYYSGIIGHSLNTIFGIDKIIFGTAAGSVIFLLSNALHNFLKTKNNGKSYFSYQKVVVPLVILVIISLILWKII